MIVLFDHGTPLPSEFLKEHTVKDAKSLGWDTLSNGDLLNAAEAAGFDVLLTSDKNIRYQQNLTGRNIAIVVLGNPQWPVLRLHPESVVAAVNAAKPELISKYRFPSRKDFYRTCKARFLHSFSHHFRWRRPHCKLRIRSSFGKAAVVCDDGR